MKKQIFCWLYVAVFLFTTSSLAMFFGNEQMIMQTSIGSFLGLCMSIILGQSIETEKETLTRFSTEGSLWLSIFYFFIFSLSFPVFILNNILGLGLPTFFDLILMALTAFAVIRIVTRKSIDNLAGRIWKWLARPMKGVF